MTWGRRSTKRTEELPRNREKQRKKLRKAPSFMAVHFLSEIASKGVYVKACAKRLECRMTFLKGKTKSVE